MTPTAEGLLEAKPQIEAIAERYGVSNIRVIGSVARGDAHEGSDVDLLVSMESGRSLLDEIGFEMEVEELLGVKVDVLTDGINPRLHAVILLEARSFEELG